MIDAAKTERFQQMLHDLASSSRPTALALNPDSAIAWPRKSLSAGGCAVYVLGGRAMDLREEADLRPYMTEAVKVSNKSPVLLDRFLNDAIEVDVDALSDGEQW